jgi:hypothetical protein
VFVIGFKPFDRESFNKYNGFVIDIVKNKLHILNHTLVENPDPHGIDIQIKSTDNEVRGYIEVESHGKHWNGVFPFPSVNFLGRKLKYVRPKVYYIMINFTGESSVMIPFERLAKYTVKRMDTSVFKNDAIINVPNENCIWEWENISKFIEADLKRIL